MGAVHILGPDRWCWRLLLACMLFLVNVKALLRQIEMAFVRLIDYTMELGLRPCALPFNPDPGTRVSSDRSRSARSFQILRYSMEKKEIGQHE